MLDGHADVYEHVFASWGLEEFCQDLPTVKKGVWFVEMVFAAVATGKSKNKISYFCDHNVIQLTIQS